jgi:peroxiredoxin Q/BCP
MPLRRRALLRDLSLGLGFLLLQPSKAFALGGTLPALNAAAPDFNLEGIAPATEVVKGVSSSKELATLRRSLADFHGHWLVLYFYPRDFTSGCTLEARGFQTALPEFTQLSARVVGVSADSSEDHAAFCGSEGLRYTLLSDPGGTVSRVYGSWLPPFSLRHTFLIDPQGVLRQIWTGVRPSGHAREVLAELQRLQVESVS